ncbi:MAG: cation-translocating P-type ATPase [Anaerovoracaceae bacterium]
MYYNKDVASVLDEFTSSTDGLSEEQVTLNREKYGENKLYEKKKKSIITIFLEQFKDLLVVILIIAAIISMATGSVESTIVIIAVLILNSILGTVQYVKAEKSLDSLKSLSAPIAKVIRGGKQLEILASELVVGDIIRLDAGDVIPGDGRLIESYSLKINESALTGESEGVEKSTAPLPDGDIALGDQVNMIFASSLVTYGRGLAVVTAVGVSSELGKIASLISNTAERKTPLQVSMDNFSKKLSFGIIVLCIIILALNVYRGMALLDSLLFAVALAVAAIPEALSSIITISLAIGTSRMADQNAIIKQLRAVEGLGCVSIICSDKTGTLTQNRMTVEEISCKPGDELKLQVAAVLCNDTVLAEGETKGDPTETALVDYYMKNNDNYHKVMDALPRLAELPFDSDRKLMSTLHNINGENMLVTKGALDVILERTVNLSDEEKEKIRQQNFDYSNQGLRVLSFAEKHMGTQTDISMDTEYDYEFIGLMAMMDPPREESAQAVTDCIKAGIKPIMITGDHKITASAIARKIGLLVEGDKAITGPELDAMSQEELMSELAHISVYARVSPDNKIRIVQAWQSLGHVVSMTGDGVNDAPALKNADIGIAMGITGTEVAKDAASMILTDDNFATIIKSVLNGRNIYANIKNAIKFLLSGNAAGIFVVLYASLAALPTPFTAVHLLFINLITDSLPALAISMEPSNPALIKDKPRANGESILTKPVLIEIILQGLVIGAATTTAFYIGLQTSPYVAMTMAFATLCMARLWHGFNSRGNESIFKLGLLSNVYTIGAFALGTALLFAILLVPFLQRMFSIAILTSTQIYWILILAFAPTVIIQIGKVIRDLIRK